MAVTSLWRINGAIGKVVLYAINPDKTVSEEIIPTENDDYENVLNDVVNYAERDSATEIKKFVSYINCTKEHPVEDMIVAKENAGKTGGVIAYHGYQSFATDEVDAQTAHDIGYKLACELWGDKYQVIVATHIDKESHIHNHFIINTVSFVDGIKFHREKQDYLKMREVSDRLCREYGLSVIYEPKDSKKNYSEYMADKEGKITKNGIIKKDIDECISMCKTEKQFYSEMAKRGYTFDFSNKYTTVTHQNFPKPRRLKTLGEEYTPSAIRKRIHGTWPKAAFDYPEQDDAEQLFFDGDFNNTLIFENYQTVYVHFVCGITAVKSRGSYNRELERLLGDDLIKFDKRVEEQNLLLDNDLYTDEDVSRFKGECENEIKELTDNRRVLRNKLKSAVRADDVALQYELKGEIKFLSERIKTLRKKSVICDRLLENEPRIENELEQVQEYAAKQKGKERDNSERIQRRSRPDR